MAKTHIVVKVYLERWVKGAAEYRDRFNYTIEADVESRKSTYQTLQKEFGRCFGAIPMGYKFGKVIEFDDGTPGFEYATVILIEGAKPAPGFVLSGGM